MNKRIFILVEGDDDKRFFERILNPMIKEKYDKIIYWKYAQTSDEKIRNFIATVGKMGACYIFTRDMDHSISIDSRVQQIKNKFANINGNSIVIVVKQIEGWYVAGADPRNKKIFKTSKFNPDAITKEQIEKIMPKKFTSKIDYYQELLNNYSIERAVNNNRSLKYFIDKYC